MKKIIRLTENDLTKIVKQVLKEERLNEKLGGMEDSHPIFGDKNLSDYSAEELDNMLNRRGNEESDFDDELEDDFGDDIDFYDETPEKPQLRPLDRLKPRVSRNNPFKKPFDGRD